MSLRNEPAACQCGSCPPARPRGPVAAHAGRTARSLPSVLLGVGIAFFPKCPFCWAAYMSALGSLGLVRVPYLPWMLPVLLGLLALHLALLLRQLARRRYAPVLLSVLGTACIFLGRSTFPHEAWLLYAGPALLVAGSLLNNLPLPISFFTKPRLAV